MTELAVLFVYIYERDGDFVCVNKQSISVYSMVMEKAFALGRRRMSLMEFKSTQHWVWISISPSCLYSASDHGGSLIENHVRFL